MKNSEILINCPLFKDFDKGELEKMLKCLGAIEKSCKKGQAIFSEGDMPRYIGIILDGAAQIVRIDYFGNKSIVDELTAPQVFGESFAFADVKALPIDVIAVKDTDVLLIDSKRIVSPCENACFFHNRLIFNLLNITAKKNLMFHQKIEITSKRSTADKLMAYLMIQAKRNNSNTFSISYDRQELADYLEVDRSGLSAEISKLRKAGKILCRKNKFTLIEK